MLSHFAATANAIAATTKKSEKERLLAAYLVTLDDASLERAAVFFSGSPFARREQKVTGIGGSGIGESVMAATGRTHEQVWAPWPRYADTGDTIAESFPNEPSRDVTLTEVGEYFDRIATTQGAGAKQDLLAELFRKVNAEGARYIVKILTGELRIGLVEGLVESSIAKAFSRKLAAVRRANMLTGDIGATALLAKSDALETAKMSLFHPFASMLAQPEEDPEEIVAALGPGAIADDKYDGIRAQIHTDGTDVRIYSRTLDDVTHRFPEIDEAARALASAVILDGELVAFRDRVLPFAVIQKRLGRRQVTPRVLDDAPVAFFAFDVLYAGGEVLLEVPLNERLDRLRSIVRGTGAIRLSEQTVVRDAAHVDELFDAARARANEGLVVKDPRSVYTPGRRGKSWLKYKKALATLDCVVTYAQYGNGRRRNVLSDLTFGIWRDGDIVNVGKAYSGLTDAEIVTLTEHFKKTGTWDGWRFKVEPTVVLEIAFDRIQESSRHKAGYALRFPRIVRIRDDKQLEQISTIDEVRRIYEGQSRREAGS